MNNSTNKTLGFSSPIYTSFESCTLQEKLQTRSHQLSGRQFLAITSTPGKKHYRAKHAMPRHLGLHGAIAAAMPAASRHLASLHDHGGAIAAVVPAAAAFLAVCALALAMCASHSGAGAAATERLRRALASVSRRRTDPVIVSIHQVQPGFGYGAGAGGDASPPPCVWQKGILMGGKCQLPDFSGVINYDPAGNMVAPGRPRALPALGW